jgi:hypothetical protein
MRNPEEFVRPMPHMAQVALVASMLANGDAELLKMRRDQGILDEYDTAITPSLGILVAELQAAA